MGSHRRRGRRAAATDQAHFSAARALLLMALLDTVESALKLLTSALVPGISSSSPFGAERLRGRC